MYKSKLQELCQQRQWELPRYTSMKDGPDHNPCFKSSLLLNGMSFNSSVPCKSCKEAQNDAAKSAFLHFTSSSYSLAVAAANPNPLQEVDLGIYKNLLLEFTQREELSLPEYKTMQCGVPHKPTFFSSVEVEGDVFYGNGGKSKKEAEINAAKVAYTKLTQRLQVSSSEICSTQHLASEHLKVVSATVGTEEYGEENEVDVGGKELEISTTSIDNSAPCSKFVPVSPKKDEVQEVETGEEEEGSMSCESKYLDISDLSISDSNTEIDPGLKSYLLNNRFRVYPCYPDIEFPKGITVLPISENKWVAVSLEFPNETNN